MASIIPEGRLVYGMQLPVQAQSRMFVEQWELSSGRDELATVARKADETGFFYVAVCDHVAIPKPLDERMGDVWYDTVATLGWLAAVTTTTRLLSHVFNVTYRHPLVTAKSFMTLDELSGGRVILGVGAGHVEGEFGLLGVDFARRGGLADEAIDSIRTAWSGEYDGSALGPRPRQATLPVWIGGSARASLRRAAERGDGWLPQGTPRSEMPASIAFLREQRQKAGRDDPIDIGTITEVLYVGTPDWDIGPRTLTGPPDQLAEQLREFGEMGVNHLQVRFRSRSLAELLDQMEAFGSEVGPLLNS